jgi:hypothetical protein
MTVRLRCCLRARLLASGQPPCQVPWSAARAAREIPAALTCRETIASMRSVGVTLALVWVIAAGLAAPTRAASPWTCGNSDPAATGADASVQASGVTVAPLGTSILMALGHPKGFIDPASVVFDVVRQEDGTSEQLRPALDAVNFKPRTPGTYLISASFWSWDCSAGPGTQSQLKGPFTTAAITIKVVPGDPPAPRYAWKLLPRVSTIPFGSAVFASDANCPPRSGSLKPITAIMRYTTDGRSPTRRSPSVRATAAHGCGTEEGRELIRHGAWGGVAVSGGGASVTVTPGHAMRVWLEYRWDGRVISAIRVRSRERGGKQRWVRDAGSCPAAPGGCARLGKWPRSG